MSFLQFNIPPLPNYTVCGEDTYYLGDAHPNRRNIGVFDLIFVTKGCLYIGEEQKKWEVHAGQSIILRPDRRHYSPKKCMEETHFYWVHFYKTDKKWIEVSHPSNAYPKENNDPFRKMDFFKIELPRHGNMQFPNQTIEKLKELVRLENQPLPINKWKQQVLLQEILLDLNTQPAVQADSSSRLLAEQVAGFLQQHYSQAISYSQLGETFNFHPTYLSRCMKNTFGCTPLEYLLSFRIEQSKLLLMNTDMTVKRISNEVGFNNVSYFIRSFTKREKLSPIQFRKQYR